jgi:cobalamin biosynthesis protein CbiG
MTPARLELKIEDALEDETLRPADLEILASIRELLKEARRSSSVTLSQRNIIVLERTGRKNRSRKTGVK